MDDARKPIIDGDPAGYSDSTIIENLSISTLEGLLNKDRIISEVKRNDKTPNFDGYLYVLDESRRRTGTLEVQVKTLPEEYFERPRWKFEKPFMAACERTAGPTLLIAANNRDQIAYWQHISIEFLTKFSMECKGESLVMEFTPGNIIDGKSEDYLAAWNAITMAALDTKFSSFSDKERIQELAVKVEELTRKTEEAALPGEVIGEIQVFLNAYNGIFEHDFKAVRDILYGQYWKIGIVIGEYANHSFRHLLLPAPFSDNSPLIRQFKQLQNTDITHLFQNQGAIVLSMNNKENPIKSRPVHYAYELIEKDVLSVVKKTHFAIDDQFAASEYIVGFIDAFSDYLGMPSAQDRYNLFELLELLDKIMPAFESTARSYREGKTDWIYNIDSCINRRPSRSNAAKVLNVKRQLAEGFVPALNIELHSSLFDLTLLRHYIRLLQGTKQEFAQRLLKPYKGEPGVGQRNWQVWDRAAVLENVKILFGTFPRLYAALLQKHFPNLKELLAFREQADLIIFTVRYPESPLFGPYLERDEFKALEKVNENKMLFFLADDPKHPFDRSSLMRGNDYRCRIDGRDFEIARISNSPVEFFDSPIPASMLVHDALKDALESYFNRMTKVK